MPDCEGGRDPTRLPFCASTPGRTQPGAPTTSRPAGARLGALTIDGELGAAAVLAQLVLHQHAVLALSVQVGMTMVHTLLVELYQNFELAVMLTWPL